jgi:hypothetical protein
VNGWVHVWFNDKMIPWRILANTEKFRKDAKVQRTDGKAYFAE